MKKILIIGGTQFVGRNLIEHLIELGTYDITLFNRGITNPDLFPEIKKIKGDRKVKEDVALLTIHSSLLIKKAHAFLKHGLRIELVTDQD